MSLAAPTTRRPVLTHTLGFPRMGAQRALKFALESFWRGDSTEAELQATAAQLRQLHWQAQADAGLGFVTVGDFALYDHVANHIQLLGCEPARFAFAPGTPELARYFAMARGVAHEDAHEGAHAADCGCGAAAAGHAALAMTKWFDTNYHYLAPELSPGQVFALTGAKPVDEFLEAKALGIHTRPVLLGPLTFLKLAKTKAEGFSPLSLLSALLPIYGEILRRLAAAGADWVQVDEPCLALDLTDFERSELRRAYGVLTHAAPDLRLMLTSYFGGYGDNLPTAVNLPVGMRTP